MSAKIIKGGEVKKGEVREHREIDVMPESGGVLHKRVLDAREQAEKIIADAESDASRVRKEAEGILERAKSEREESIKKGFAEGESKGLAQVTEKLMHVEQLRETFYDQAEPEIIKLVLSIAEKVIGKLAEEHANVIRNVVHQALERAIGDRITVRLNPEDYKTIMESEHEFKDILDRTRRLMFREDEEISKGGCVVETEVGTIDARLETQLEAIRKALTA
jgi:flagellar assembly protein FliH